MPRFAKGASTAYRVRTSATPTVQAVGCHGAKMAAVGRVRPTAPLLAGTQPGAAHAPRHAMPSAGLARAPQRHGQTRAAVGAPARLEKLARLARQMVEDANSLFRGSKVVVPATEETSVAL